MLTSWHLAIEFFTECENAGTQMILLLLGLIDIIIQFWQKEMEVI